MIFTHKLLYPEFEKYILSETPKVQYNQRVWTALLDAAGIKPGKLSDTIAVAKARWVLRTGTPVEIVPAFWDSEEVGAFSPKTPDKIYFNKYCLDLFEKDYSRDDARLFVLATVLHETVHLLDYWKDGKLQDRLIPTNNVSNTKRPSSAAKDQGDIFEEKAYGGKVPFWKS